MWGLLETVPYAGMAQRISYTCYLPVNKQKKYGDSWDVPKLSLKRSKKTNLVQ